MDKDRNYNKSNAKNNFDSSKNKGSSDKGNKPYPRDGKPFKSDGARPYQPKDGFKDSRPYQNKSDSPKPYTPKPEGAKPYQKNEGGRPYQPRHVYDPEDRVRESRPRTKPAPKNFDLDNPFIDIKSTNHKPNDRYKKVGKKRYDKSRFDDDEYEE